MPSANVSAIVLGELFKTVPIRQHGVLHPDVMQPSRGAGAEHFEVSQSGNVSGIGRHRSNVKQSPNDSIRMFWTVLSIFLQSYLGPALSNLVLNFIQDRDEF